MIDWLIEKVPTSILVFLYIIFLLIVGLYLSKLLGV